MKRSITFFLTLGNKKYPCTFKRLNDNETHVQCEAAKISQTFPHEDIPALLEDLPDLIVAEREYVKRQTGVIRFRISQVDKEKIEKKAYKKGYHSVSSYLRDLALKDKEGVSLRKR